MGKNSAAQMGLLAAAGVLAVRSANEQRALKAVKDEQEGENLFVDKYKIANVGTAVFVDPINGTNSTAKGAGSQVAPLQTVAAALSAIGPAVSKADFEAPRTLYLGPGVHAIGGLSLAMRRWNLLLAPGAQLGGGNFSAQLVAAQAFGSTLPPLLSIAKTEGESGFSFANALRDIVGNITAVQGAGPAVTAWAAFFRGLFMGGVAAPATVTAGGVNAQYSQLANPVAFPGGGEVIGNDTVFQDTIAAANIRHHDSTFFKSLTTTLAANNGFFNCKFQAPGATFTGPAGSFRTDGNSNNIFNGNGWVLGGAATKVNLDGFLPFV